MASLAGKMAGSQEAEAAGWRGDASPRCSGRMQPLSLDGKGCMAPPGESGWGGENDAMAHLPSGYVGVRRPTGPHPDPGAALPTFGCPAEAVKEKDPQGKRRTGRHTRRGSVSRPSPHPSAYLCLSPFSLLASGDLEDGQSGTKQPLNSSLFTPGEERPRKRTSVQGAATHRIFCEGVLARQPRGRLTRALRQSKSLSRPLESPRSLPNNVSKVCTRGAPEEIAQRPGFGIPTDPFRKATCLCPWPKRTGILIAMALNASSGEGRRCGEKREGPGPFESSTGSTAPGACPRCQSKRGSGGQKLG